MRTVREFSSTVVVAALGALFGAVMLIASSTIGSVVGSVNGLDDVTTVTTLLDVVGYLFLAIALYVSAVVTANTCSTVIAGQTRIIALQRLIGASGSTLRRQIAGKGVVVGAVGAVVGTVLAVVLAFVAVRILVADGTLPDTSYSFVPPTLLVPLVAVVLTTWGAFATGSRRVLTVRPLEALSSTIEPRREDLRSSTLRIVMAVVLVVVGAGLLVLGLLIGAASAYGVLVAALGGFVSFTGIAVGATLFVPPVLALVGRIGARNPAVLLSGRNALRAPGRASRATIGLVIGVTLLVTFAVALGTFQHQIDAQLGSDPAVRQALSTTFATLNSVVGFLTGFSGVIAGVGVVNALALGVLQRRREIGLLRALGFTGAQVRTMIVVEALQMVVTALVMGLVLGTLYGWAGAVALFGSEVHGAITPVLPLTTVVVVVVGALLLAVAASVAPVRNVMRVAPTEALAVD
jgi:putative ABC transport system permease protein